MILPSLFLDKFSDHVYNNIQLSRHHSRKHIVDENSVPHGRIIHHDVRHRTDKPAGLDDGRTAHECGKVGATHLIANCQNNLSYIFGTLQNGVCRLSLCNGQNLVD